MAQISVTLDGKGRLVNISGDMGKNVEFRRRYGAVSEILIDNQIAVTIRYHYGRVREIVPGPAASMLHLSFGD